MVITGKTQNHTPGNMTAKMDRNQQNQDNNESNIANKLYGIAATESFSICNACPFLRTPLLPLKINMAQFVQKDLPV